MSIISTVIAQAAASAPAAASATAPAGDAAQQGGGMNMIFVMLLMLAALYFLMIRPQQTQRKKHQQMINALKSGDKIVTIGGLFGTITNVKEKTYVLKIADNTKIEILKGAVQEKVASADDEADIEIKVESK